MAAELSANALRVLEARYLRRDAGGRVIETAGELFHRVARSVAQAEVVFGTGTDADRWQEAFHAVMTSLDFLPSSSVLMNAGTPLGQLAACFVLPVDDTLESIFEALKSMALVQRGGGGTGFSFSRLRPAGDVLQSTGGQASGPVSFMRVFDTATQNIKLGGRRRGANMGVLRVDHPDVLEFIDAKLAGSLENFNLSVAVTDAFMQAVDAGGRYDLVHPGNRRVLDHLDARCVFARIADRAWRTGDPGVIYLDTVNRASPTPALGDIEATNPCGEVPLLAWESCVLGSVNLANMVLSAGHGAPTIDWNRLHHAVRVGIRFLDDVIEVNRDPLAPIAAATRRTRKVGLGVMGFAECLILLGVAYDTVDAAAWAERIALVVAEEARRATRDLAAARGVFPSWDRSVFAERGDRRRNATLVSIAPTGTLSIIAGTSSGIEPLFAVAYRREHTLGGPPFAELNPIFARLIDEHRVDRAAVLKDVVTTGMVRDVPGVPPELARLFVTATEIPVSQHLHIQQAFQRHVDNAVSKTINLPESADAHAVADAFLDGWRLGLKGVTVYRSGSKPGQVLTIGVDDDASAREHFTKCDPAACRL